MVIIDYEEVSLAEIVTFLTVARLSSMSLAAEKLSISQPAVSKRVAHLEKTYGLILFIRTKRGLELTPAGRVFMEEMQKAVGHVHQAFSKALDAQTTPVRSLTLGYDSIFDQRLLYEIIQLFHSRNPGSKVTVYNYLGKNNEDCCDLFDGTADVMITPNAFFESMRDQLCSEVISSYQFTILVSEGHPLASKKQVDIPDLLGFSLTIAHMNDDSPYVRTIKNIFAKYGLRPRFEHFAAREDLCLEILNNNSIGIATPSFYTRFNSRTSEFFSEHLRVFPIPDAFYPVSLVWRAENTNPCVAPFLEAFHECLAREENRGILAASYN